MTRDSQISSSLEDYLEAIYHTENAKGAARAKDLVQALGVQNSSVTQALRALSERHLVNYAPYDVITLTDPGRRLARDVVKRHTTMKAFLTQVLGLPEDAADEGACRMEHNVSGEIIDRLVKFVEYFEQCPLADVRWDDQVGFFCDREVASGGRTCGRDTCGSGLELDLPAAPPMEEK
ncbi:metal-dependent transcriptional regulator [bacterium CG17_big_fil_post_rev_8_21_14_2_50_64_8]|nr:MAG: metal-dependent transcriptional regulator [bacterium CG17_big_fil_post_rev_8_21_14_2_50_64_8]PJA76715.1 MAG: metal-dependent transcriptional regulator [bacterium CG_4_9_14_3_um_filter_65_15]